MLNFKDAIAMPGMSADRSVCAPKKGRKVKGLKGIHLEFATPDSEFPTYQPLLYRLLFFSEILLR